MDYYQETFDTWNNIALLYQEKFMDLDLYNESYDYICQHLSKNKASILEIACGPGNITRYLLSQRPDFQLLGIDIAPNMIALAQQNIPTASFAVMDARDIDKIENTFDGIVCGFCLPYLSLADCAQLFASCYARLNKEGLLYISFVAGAPSQSGYQVGKNGNRMYFHFHEKETLINLLHQKEFELQKTFDIAYKISEEKNDIHTIIIAKKQ